MRAWARVDPQNRKSYGYIYIESINNKNGPRVDPRGTTRHKLNC